MKKILVLIFMLMTFLVSGQRKTRFEKVVSDTVFAKIIYTKSIKVLDTIICTGTVISREFNNGEINGISKIKKQIKTSENVYYVVIALSIWNTILFMFFILFIPLKMKKLQDTSLIERVKPLVESMTEVWLRLQIALANMPQKQIKQTNK